MAGRYKFLEKIGAGANATVYRARDLHADGGGGRDVAIKHFDCDCMEGGSTPVVMLYETAAMRYMTPHRNIVAMLDVFDETVAAVVAPSPSHRHRLFSIVYEYMEMDLNAYLARERGRFNPLLACSYAYQLLAALAHAHSCGVMHCDVKPANLLIDAAGALKLADFGSAHVTRLRRETSPPSACTLWYCAPEVLIKSSSLCDARLDVWAAACVIAEMVGHGHGAPPLFPGDNDCDQMMRVWRRLGAPPADVLATATIKMPYVLEQMPTPQGAAAAQFELHGTPPLALDLLRTMLRTDPRSRPTAAECLRHAYFDEIRVKFSD
jgi:serine/threonine protein kinase